MGVEYVADVNEASAERNTTRGVWYKCRTEGLIVEGNFACV